MWMKSGALNTFLGLDLADFGRDPQQLESRAKFCFFLSGKQPTILLISCRPNFTKFEHSTLIGVADENFQYKILKLLP